MERPDLKAEEMYVRAVLSGGGTLDERSKKAIVRIITGNVSFLQEMLKLSKENMEAIETGYEKAGYMVGSINVVLKSEGLVGIGSGAFKSIFEVGLNIDPILGLPYYPGSGIKGAVRSFIESFLPSGKGIEYLEEIFGSSRANKGEEVSSSDGSSGAEGMIVFSDMYPIGCKSGGCSIYTPLVITPHYFKGGKVVDTELDVQPVPVVHIGISKDLVFKLIIAIRKDLKERLMKNLKGIFEMIKKSDGTTPLFKGIREDPLIAIGLITIYTLNMGIGARSAKGYNLFEPYSGPLAFKVSKYVLRR
ncbi:hypothetical protein EYM_01770 [Ignicoccus islandicus DSM 13165]|uniref:CRISPR type III-associated protein domain-containing protein n=1 Tax=Ignicoccus islandicus DSM 13165 TaxID=940295 RepID=A0A0U3F3X4_9CREN|nr:type III-B CRISPR module RAMP protein Cmr6 [Ignicoccus islandicus]ALU12245.1 hypothetical protein EYM_01770 [Ignicoccus islandicus DSM 13165]